MQLYRWLQFFRRCRLQASTNFPYDVDDQSHIIMDSRGKWVINMMHSLCGNAFPKFMEDFPHQFDKKKCWVITKLKEELFVLEDQEFDSRWMLSKMVALLKSCKDQIWRAVCDGLDQPSWVKWSKLEEGEEGDEKRTWGIQVATGCGSCKVAGVGQSHLGSRGRLSFNQNFVSS